MSKARRNLAYFLMGLGDVLTSAGKALQREKPIHPAFLSNEEIARARAIRTRPLPGKKG